MWLANFEKMMGTIKDKHLAQYENLRNEIDRHVEFLEDVHRKDMKCENGCDMCCMDYSVFPIEFHYVLNELGKSKNKLPRLGKSENGSCIFLQDHSCAIYEQRPIICRTHGLPLLFANDAGEWELSACELNFKDFDFEDFTMENTLPQDKYNSKLFMLNKAFIADFKAEKYGEFDLIPLKDMVGRLK